MRNTIILGLVALALSACADMTPEQYADFHNTLNEPIPNAQYQYPQTSQPMQLNNSSQGRNQNYMINTPGGMVTGSCRTLANGYVYCP